MHTYSPDSFSTGQTQRRRTHTLPGQKKMLRRIQVSQVQKEVDERQFLGQHGTRMYQMPHQRLSTQTGTAQRKETDIHHTVWVKNWTNLAKVNRVQTLAFITS